MGVDLSQVRARRAELTRQKQEFMSGQNLLELKEGDNFVRILPPRPEANGAWRKRAMYHYNLMEKDVVLCPRVNGAKLPCPACDLAHDLFKEKNDASTDMAKQIRAKDRFFTNVISLDKNDGKVYILPFGSTVEEQIIDIMAPEEGKVAGGFGYGDITDPVKGYDLRITKAVPKDKRQTSYAVSVARNPSPVANWNTIKDALHNLDEFVNKKAKTYEEIKAILDGTGTTHAAPPGAGQTASPAGTAPVDPGTNFEPPRGTGEFGPPAGQTPQTTAAPGGSPAAPAVPATPEAPKSEFETTMARLRGLRK